MWRKVLKLSASPRVLLRSILALDDSPHAVALGVAVGIFVGLTPTVGIQTVLILALVFLCRRVCYFNGPAAMASTYVSNPFTMLPMYYFWYRLGIWFFPGSDTNVNLDALTNFDGLSGWWNAMCALGIQVGGPMFVGALLTAPFGAVAAYVATYFALKHIRRSDDDDTPSDGSAGGTDDVTRVDEATTPVGTHKVLECVGDAGRSDTLVISP